VTTAPRGVTRFVLFSASSGQAIVALLEPYAPTAVYRSAHAVHASTLSFHGSEQWPLLADGELTDVVLTLAEDHPGHTIAIAVPAEDLRALLCHALGVPALAAERFVVVDDTVSVLELDPKLRWAVVRLNEGRALPGDA
jgi:hypothetical protein